jgi:hypothetical protein
MIVRRAGFRKLAFDDKEVGSLAIDVDQDLDLIVSALTGNIAFGTIGAPNKEAGGRLENINGVWIVHLFGAAANTDETLPHQLGRVPSGLINVERPIFTGAQPLVGTVYFGSVNPTKSAVTLRCSVASKQATVFLF